MNVEILIQCVVAYLLGGIPSGVWLGKLFYQTDIRDYGSGNTGATNTFRILGPKAGVVALIIDVLKGTVATLIPLYFGSVIHPIFIGAFAIIGHVFSIYINFSGGKAVATTAGVVLAIQPLFVLGFIGLFLIILLLTSIVSVASMVTILAAAIGSLFLGDMIFAVGIWLLALFIIYLHRENINRLRKGTESRVPFGLRSSKKDE